VNAAGKKGIRGTVPASFQLSSVYIVTFADLLLSPFSRSSYFTTYREDLRKFFIAAAQMIQRYGRGCGQFMGNDFHYVFLRK
jgi:hypothetical protein